MFKYSLLCKFSLIVPFLFVSLVQPIICAPIDSPFPQPTYFSSCASTISSSLHISSIQAETMANMLDKNLVQCGSINVPLDWNYADRYGHADQTINLNFTRLSFSPDPIQAEIDNGLIFGNPGGPGFEAQTSALAQAFNMTDSFSAYLQNFTLIAVDVRGTGTSTTVKCDPVDWSLANPPIPRDQEQFESLQANFSRFAQSCIDNSVPGLLENLDSESVVRDFDLIRKSLGAAREQTKVNYIGLSYGTFIGLDYIRLFSDTLRTIVLDGISPQTQKSSQDSYNIITEAKARQREYEQLSNWCDTNDTCSLHSQGPGAFNKTVNDIISRAKTTPYEIENCSRTGEGGKELCLPQMDDLDVNFRLSDFLADMDSWIQISDALPKIMDSSDTSILKLLYANNTDEQSNRGMSQRGIWCLDRGSDLTTWQDISPLIDELNQIAPQVSYSGATWANTVQCSSWPISHKERKAISSDKQVLLVASAFDPSTPIEYAYDQLENLPNAALAVRNGNFHTSFEMTSNPIRDIIDSYIFTTNLPDAKQSGDDDIQIIKN